MLVSIIKENIKHVGEKVTSQNVQFTFQRDTASKHCINHHPADSVIHFTG